MSRFCAEYREFQDWAKRRKFSPSTAIDLDKMGAECLDFLFFEGYQAERGEKLIAAFQSLHPEIGTAASGSLPRMRAGMRGFRRLAHGYSRTPLVLEAVYAIIGPMVSHGQLDMGRAILVGWDAFLRIPSDLVRLTKRSLIAPVPELTGNRWGLLLYPEEAVGRSKTAQFDESVILEHPASAALDPVWRTKLPRGPRDGPLWDFPEIALSKEFNRVVAELVLPPSTVAYQIRHGAASYAALLGTLSIAQIQRRLRHGSPIPTQRYEKHTRYLSEVGKLSPEIRAYGTWVGENLPALLLGTLSPISFDQFCRSRGCSSGRTLTFSAERSKKLPPAKRKSTSSSACSAAKLLRRSARP